LRFGDKETAMSLPHVERKESDDTHTVRVGDALFGSKEIVIISGPCAVESAEQVKQIAELALRTGTKVLRGGIFKPRTSPYSFQGLGRKAIEILRNAADEANLPIVSEVMDSSQVDEYESIIDMLQIGSRNMHNFSLLKRVGKSNRPVLLKRGMSATLEELLNAAEYIMNEGNDQVVLCERGIRTFNDFSRNTFDLTIIPKIKQVSKLPIIADPSHGTGDREMVIPVARAAIAAGADGVMIEVQYNPDKALSDSTQTLYPEQLVALVEDIRKIAPAVNREFK
jgi:3-deoxy-7-phosphoheptulonate synthase